MLWPLICTGNDVPLFAADFERSELMGYSAEATGDIPASIVIIEDNPGDVFMMEEALREHSVNCSVTVLTDGEQANQFFQRIEQDMTSTCPNLVLLDLNLPKRSGHWVLTHIRNGYRCASVPVIIVSSSDAESDLMANSTLGATAYFRKPSSLVEFMKLGAVVNNLI
jgi:DNA-binding response OmpR family regulator